MFRMIKALNIKWKLLGTEKDTIQEHQTYLKGKERNIETKQNNSVDKLTAMLDMDR